MPPPFERGKKLDTGGEATVYSVANQPGLLLKVFNEDLEPKDRARIEKLIAARTPSLDAIAAWPQALVDSEGKPALVLPLVQPDPFPIHVLFDRSSWLRTIRDANWRFMIFAAMAFAEAVADVHRAGMIVCDISEKNALVLRTGQVALIDCNSFVFAGRGGESISPN